MKLSDALVEALIALDVQYVFGVSGANIEHLHDAIHRLGRGRLKSVMAKSEDGAGFMADCRARVHRSLGVCCATSGGGMMNLAAGIAESFAESVPVLALVGQPPLSLEGTGAFQESSGIGRSVDSLGIWRSITKYAAKVSDPQTFWHHLNEAVKAALSGRPGPAVLLLPRDVFDKDVDPVPAGWINTLKDETRPAEVIEEMVRPLWEEIDRAESPVIIFGQGVRRCSDPRAVSEFAKSVGIPVATTLSGRAEFPNDDPLYLGMLGVAGHPSVHDYLKEQADLIIVVGSGLNLMTRHPLDVVLKDKRVAVVNIDVGQITRVMTPTVVIEADAGEVFRMLSDLQERKPIKVKPAVRYARRIFKPILAPPLPADSNGCETGQSTLLQSEAIASLQPFLPVNGHLLYDAGNCATAVMHMTGVPSGTSSTIALGMGGMGYAIAASIGAQLGSGKSARTVVFAGDGAFLISGFEVHTAVELGLPILYVIFNNSMHGMCAMRQQFFFESRLECVRYSRVDIAQVARGFGDARRLWVGSAGTKEELRRQLDLYREKMSMPGVLELRLSREEVPPFTPFLTSDAQTLPVC
jgi:acetolactate synthase-1/2/3 large subunit